MNSTWELILTDYEKEDQSSYIERMSSLFPNIPRFITSFFWNTLKREDFKKLFCELDFSKLKVEERKVSTEELLSIDHLFHEFVEGVSQNPVGKIEVYSHIDGTIESWRDEGTWKVPVMIFCPKVKGNTPMKAETLIEGHTRLGILRGLMKSHSDAYKVHAEHKAFFLYEN